MIASPKNFPSRAAWLAALTAFVLGTIVAAGAPLTLKELEFLVRQQTPEKEIMKEVTARRLLVPLDAAAVSSLKQNGASDSLIGKLRAPGLGLDPKAAAAEMRRQADSKAKVDAILAEEAAFRELRDRQWRQTAERLREARTVQGWLNEKLYTLDRSDLKAVDSRSIDPVRIFGFVHAAMGSPPSRDFAPQLAEAYGRLKKQYGNDFEIIVVSHDRDDFNQKEFLRTFGLKCPTMKATAADPALMQYVGAQLPWFVLVAESGKPLSVNGVNKQFLAPEQVLAGLEQLLAALHR